MARKPVPYTHQFAHTMCQLGGDGLLLVATKPGGESNVMTIGWGTIGPVWGRPVFTVLVRPSRYTYQFIEEANDFTVNVPTPDMSEFVLYCGTKSGRAHDKLARFQMSVSPGRMVKSVTIDACPLVYECQVIQKNDVNPKEFDAAIPPRFYARGDFHRVYYGEIMGTHAAE